MKSLEFHPNLVCMLGYEQDTARPLLILELCEHKDLLQYLRKNANKYASANKFCLVFKLICRKETQKGTSLCALLGKLVVVLNI
jgi:hypothetical protein